MTKASAIELFLKNQIPLTELDLARVVTKNKAKKSIFKIDNTHQSLFLQSPMETLDYIFKQSSK